MLADAFLQVYELMRLGGPLWKESLVDIRRGVAMRAPNDDGVALFVPLENRPRRKAELSANLDRNRYLPLCGDAGTAQSSC